MKRRKLRKVMSVVSTAALTAALALGSVSAGSITAEAESESGNVLAAFEDPDSDAKPMVRWWFSDAWAGIDDDDMIEEYIQELADAGYGGVEITMLSSGGDMDNDELATYGWGTESWVKLLKKALKAANEIEGGFTVDITITGHWPCAMNDVDPNDPEQQQELIYTTQSAVVSEDGTISLELPETKLYDSPTSTGIDAAAFIFTDTLEDAYLIKKDESGNYDYDAAINLSDIEGAITQTEAYTAGVPTYEAFVEWYGSYYDDTEAAYQQYVLDIYGEAADIADCADSFNGKMDSDGNRARMADTQYYYTLDTTVLSAEIQADIEAGEYYLVNTYSRGTGQIMSDATFGGAQDIMYSRTYVTNYFSEGGTDAIIDYWEEYILDDELRALLAANGSSIFEDSIEASPESGGSFWSEDVVERFEEDYGSEVGDNLTLIVALSGSLSSDEIDISDAQSSYQITLANLYDEVHSGAISDWAATFGYTYRAQCYQISGQDIIASASSVDIPEGDNSYKGDGLRAMASVINVYDKESFSMEAVTGMGMGKLNWADVVTEVAQNYSDGVNHVVLHGSPYAKSVTGYIADWPGWTAFGSNFADSYAIWRCDFDDMDNLTGYMARTQAVLQEGTAKIDVLFLKDSSSGSSLGSGNTFQELLNEGYSYNLTTEALFESENMVVTNGVLDEDGPAYKALVLNSVSSISSGGMETILEYAKAGLPIVLYNTNVTDIYGLETETNTVAALLEAYEELQTYSNVKTVSSQTELLAALQELGVYSDASYDGEYLEITHYEDESNGSDYYYLYNNPEEATSNSGMVQVGQNSKYKNGDSITTVVTLEGEGVPYELDAWTGEVIPIAGYTDNGDGTISVEVTVDGGESMIIGLLNEKTETTYVTSADENAEYDSDGNLVYKSNEAGTVTVELSDGTTQEVTIDSELETLDLSTGWTLTIESYAPSEDLDSAENIYGYSEEGYVIYVDPTLTDITEETFDIDTLVLWENIEATEDQLANLGVESMDDISGIGYYTNIFDLPEGWSESTGAVLELSYSQDMVISVTVNGNEISAIDNASDKVDIGEYLQTGENTITIKMATTMFNAMEASGRQAITLAGDSLMTGTDHCDYGITSVTLSPYSTVVVAESVIESDDDDSGNEDSDTGNDDTADDSTGGTDDGTTDDTDDADDTNDADDADDTDDSDDAAASDDTSDSGSSSATKTGDTATTFAFVVMICAAAAVIAGVSVKRKRMV